MLLFSSTALLAVTNQSLVTIVTTTCMHSKERYNSFFIANMVSGMDHVPMLPTMPTQWNMAAILQLKPSHAALV